MDWEDGGWFQWIEIEIEGVAVAGAWHYCFVDVDAIGVVDRCTSLERYIR